jgi:hypothetical protein
MMRWGCRAAGILAGLLAAGAWAQEPPDTGGDKFPMPDAPPELGQAAQAVKGSLAVRAVQGTPGGPPIGAAPVTIQLHHRGMLFDTVETKLDEHGVTVLEDLPVGMDLQPVVQVIYKDLTYQQVGETMNAANPQQSVDVVCYEPSDAAPDWAITMWHIMMDRRPPGLFVTEVVVVENPGNRTWTGTTGAGTRAVTTSFALHERARDVALGRGFHDWCCTTHTPGSLINHLPLMPQTTEFRFSYAIPAEDDGVDLDIVAAAPADHVLVAFPADITVRNVEGLTLSGTDMAGPRPVVAYRTSNLGRGQRLSLGLAGLGMPRALNGGAGGAAGFSKIAVVVGVGVLLLLGVVIVLARSGRSAPAESWPS